MLHDVVGQLCPRPADAASRAPNAKLDVATALCANGVVEDAGVLVVGLVRKGVDPITEPLRPCASAKMSATHMLIAPCRRSLSLELQRSDKWSLARQFLSRAMIVFPTHCARAQHR